jgi:hypothetical protein
VVTTVTGVEYLQNGSAQGQRMNLVESSEAVPILFAMWAHQGVSAKPSPLRNIHVKYRSEYALLKGQPNEFVRITFFRMLAFVYCFCIFIALFYCTVQLSKLKLSFYRVLNIICLYFQ